MKYCPKCGTQLVDEAIFCSKCGVKQRIFNEGSIDNTTVEFPKSEERFQVSGDKNNTIPIEENDALKDAEDKIRKELEPKVRIEIEERIRKEVEEKIQKEVEEKTRKEAEEKARREAEEKARREAEEKARREAEEKARREAEEKARREAEEKARKEAEEKARKEAEEKVRREAEEKARKEAKEKARKEAEEKARREAEEKTRNETEEKQRSEEYQRKAAEEQHRLLEEEKNKEAVSLATGRKEEKAESRKNRIGMVLALCVVLIGAVILFVNVERMNETAVAENTAEGIETVETTGQTLEEMEMTTAETTKTVKESEAMMAETEVLTMLETEAMTAETTEQIRSYDIDQIEVGDIILFGQYEQDGNNSNGKEDIEWIVLEKKENQIFLISKYVLDYKLYNLNQTAVTWKKCTLRNWLNNDFLNTAFNSLEQEMLQKTLVTADRNPNYSTNPGKDTSDKIFILSIPEAERYFASDAARRCTTTMYAKRRGASNGKWRLRSPGIFSDCSADVIADGSINYSGDFVHNGGDGVRPAMWIAITEESIAAEESMAQAVQDFSEADVGSTILHGQYEQDNNTSNGKEDIEWIVLEKQDGKLLVISRYALDSMPYHKTGSEVTWETCDLRVWLNDDFLNEAFSETEQGYISETSVPADKNSMYDTDPGNDTVDKMFVLSYKEYEKYLVKEKDRECVPTAYASANGAWSNDKHESGGSTNTYWWLRTPGFNNKTALLVGNDGAVEQTGAGVNSAYRAVRPAMWIKAMKEDVAPEESEVSVEESLMDSSQELTVESTEMVEISLEEVETETEETMDSNVEETMTEANVETTVVTEAVSSNLQEFWLNQTDGIPEGEPEDINYTFDFCGDYEESKIITYTIVHLNNGYVRLRLHYKVPQEGSISCFDPPEGIHYMYKKRSVPTEGIMNCDISDEEYASNHETTIKLYTDDQNRAFIGFVH